MEYGLRHAAKANGVRENRIVLILVVMEYGLRRPRPRPRPRRRPLVLILVVMEYGLRLYDHSGITIWSSS